MASDCTKVFKDTRQAGINAGLSEAAAVAMAQTAMAACLGQQNSRSTTVASPVVTSDQAGYRDSGPVVDPVTRR